MAIPSAYANENLRVLGVAIRSKRLEIGYSLRDLSDITKISHTLISNIEKGKQSPAPETLRDILNALHLEFHDDEELLDNMKIIRHRMIYALMHHEYEEAGQLFRQLEKDEDIYLYSPQLINYLILKYLYLTMTGVRSKNIDQTLEHYMGLSEFFGDLQYQMFLFIVGLNHLNHERYNRALETMNQALLTGNKEYDVFIKQYIIISMVRQYKFMDAFNLAKEVIDEFENRTIYIRAMQVKLQVARVYYIIHKFKEIEEIIEQVERFARKYKDPRLINELLLIRVAVLLKQSRFDEAEKAIKDMPEQKSIPVALHRFKLARLQNRTEEIKKVYKEVMKFPEVKNHYKIPKLLTVQAMYKVPELYDEEVYLSTIEYLCEKAVENNDQDIIGIAYNYLLEYYYSKRQYKKATEVAQEFLHHKRILQKL